MKPFFLIAFCLLAPGAALQAQNNNTDIRKGNQLYRQGQYDAAGQAFDKALNTDPKNPLASYNLGNAQFRSNKSEDAAKAWETAIGNSSTKEMDLKEKAWYNKGVSMIKQQNLQESIAAWKEALKLDPDDKEARENLQKALQQQKQQQQQNKEREQKKQPQKQEQPKEQQSKLNKQQVDQLLKALQQKEKEIQQRMQQKNASPNKPDKDW